MRNSIVSDWFEYQFGYCIAAQNISITSMRLVHLKSWSRCDRGASAPQTIHNDARKFKRVHHTESTERDAFIYESSRFFINLTTMLAQPLRRIILFKIGQARKIVSPRFGNSLDFKNRIKLNERAIWAGQRAGQNVQRRHLILCCLPFDLAWLGVPSGCGMSSGGQVHYIRLHDRL